MERNDLATGRFTDVQWVSQTGSTNADLSESCVSKPTSGAVLIANEQTAGRGRLDRSWEMEPGGGLMISFYVPWTVAESAHLVPMCLGVAMSITIGKSGRTALLKWPNDIVVGALDGADLDGKKLGGMLSSSVLAKGQLAGVVAGLGCNVSWPPLGFAELPDAAALHHLDGDPIDVQSLAAELIKGFDDELSRVSSSGPDQLLGQYRDRCATLGQLVRVESAGSIVVGRATDIDPSGALLVEVDHRQKRIDVGDVIHLRPWREQSTPPSE